MGKSIQERIKHLETTIKSCCHKFYKLKEEVDSLVTTVDSKAEAPIVVTPVEVLTTGWTLVSGIYEKIISDASILATSVVYIVPENDDLDIIQNAEVYPKTLSGVGTVTIYAKTIPTASFTVTLNIFN